MAKKRKNPASDEASRIKAQLIKVREMIHALFNGEDGAEDRLREYLYSGKPI